MMRVNVAPAKAGAAGLSRTTNRLSPTLATPAFAGVTDILA